MSRGTSIVGCYVLHLTCDISGCNRKSVEFTGESKREAFKNARRVGWWLKESACEGYGLATCPTHTALIKRAK